MSKFIECEWHHDDELWALATVISGRNKVEVMSRGGVSAVVVRRVPGGYRATVFEQPVQRSAGGPAHRAWHSVRYPKIKDAQTAAMNRWTGADLGRTARLLEQDGEDLRGR